MAQRKKRVVSDNVCKPVRQQFVDYNEQIFRWSFIDYDRAHSCWQFNTVNFIDEILSKLEHYSTMTWGQVLSASGGRSHGTNSHFIPFTSMVKEYKKQFIKLGLAEKYDNVFSLRLTSTKRLVGVRDKNVFKILWYGPEHNIVLSEQKHT